MGELAKIVSQSLGTALGHLWDSLQLQASVDPLIHFFFFSFFSFTKWNYSVTEAMLDPEQTRDQRLPPSCLPSETSLIIPCLKALPGDQRDGMLARNTHVHTHCHRAINITESTWLSLSQAFSWVTMAAVFISPLSKPWGCWGKILTNFHKEDHLVYLITNKGLVDIHMEHKCSHVLCPFQEAHPHSFFLNFFVTVLESYTFQALDHLAKSLAKHMN